MFTFFSNLLFSLRLTRARMDIRNAYSGLYSVAQRRLARLSAQQRLDTLAMKNAMHSERLTLIARCYAQLGCSHRQFLCQHQIEYMASMDNQEQREAYIERFCWQFPDVMTKHKAIQNKRDQRIQVLMLALFVILFPALMIYLEFQGVNTGERFATLAGSVIAGSILLGVLGIIVALFPPLMHLLLLPLMPFILLYEKVSGRSFLNEDSGHNDG